MTDVDTVPSFTDIFAAFAPVAFKVRQVGSEYAVIAEDQTGAYRGIVIGDEPEHRATFEHVLSAGQSTLLTIWQQYRDDRGAGEVLFGDLDRIVTAMRKAPMLGLGRLASFGSSADGLHNATQAILMAEAETLRPGQVVFDVPSNPAAKHGDFVIDHVRRFEVKSILRTFGVELVDGPGWRLKDVPGLIVRLQTKAAKGFDQVGVDGTVVIALWCDVANAIIANRLAPAECDLAHVFLPGQVVIYLSVDDRDRWFAFPRAEWPDKLAALASELEVPRKDRLTIPATRGYMNVFSAHEAGDFSIGVPFQIDNQQTSNEYTGPEWDAARAGRPLRRLDSRLLLGQFLKARWAVHQCEHFATLSPQIPTGQIVGDALRAAPWFTAAALWFALLADVLLTTQFALERGGGSWGDPIETDLVELAPALVPVQAGWLSFDRFYGLPATVASLMTLRELRILRRLTFGAAELLEREHTQRVNEQRADSPSPTHRRDLKLSPDERS